MVDTRARDLSELCEGAAYCRAFGHSWVDLHPPKNQGRKGRKAGWACSLICDRCHTEKHFMLSHRGELTAPRYVYPPQYLASFFIGPDERAAMRLEALGLPVVDSPAVPAPPNHLRPIEGGKAG